MYATVRRYEGVTDTREVARIVNEYFVPAIREIPGFVDYYLVDGGDVYFNEAERGGHFPAWEEPQIFAEEMRAAFRSLR